MWISCISLALSALIAVCSASPPHEPFIPHALSHQIDLSGSVTRCQSTLVLEYIGSGLIEETFEITVSDDVYEKLSWFEVNVGKVKANGLAKVRTGLPNTNSRTQSLIIDLPPSSLAAGANVTLTINEVYTHLSVPKPRTLEQTAENQYMFWSGDLMGGLTSSRTFNEVLIRVKIPMPKVKSFSTPAEFTSLHVPGSNTIAYTSKAPISGPILASVHYEQPEPVVSFRKLERLIEVSHWGANLAVEDRIALVNDGPALKGHFARITHQLQSYMRKATAAAHVLSGLAFTLPADSHSPYVIDAVGNVSTSNFRTNSSPFKRHSGAILEIRPRYPLMGGWRYDFTMGYSVPLSSFLRTSKSGLCILSVPFITPLKDVAIDEVQVNITLPEGASSVKVEVPFPVKIEQFTHYSYLDTTGRPTISLTKTACTDRHALDVFVTYRYSRAALIQKPLVVSLAVMLIYLTGMTLRRVRWTIGAGIPLTFAKLH